MTAGPGRCPIVVHAGPPAMLPLVTARGQDVRVEVFHPDATAWRGASVPGQLAVWPLVLGRETGMTTLAVTRDPRHASPCVLDDEAIDEQFGRQGASDPWVAARSIVARREVGVTSLDAWAAQHGCPHVHLLSLRTPGMEHDALQGAQDLLRGRHVSVVCTDVAFRPAYREQARFADIDELVVASGFSFVDCRVSGCPDIGRCRPSDAPWRTASGVATYVLTDALEGRCPDAAETTMAAYCLAWLGYGGTAAHMLAAQGHMAEAQVAAWLERWARPTRLERRLASMRRWLPPLLGGA